MSDKRFFQYGIVIESLDLKRWSFTIKLSTGIEILAETMYDPDTQDYYPTYETETFAQHAMGRCVERLNRMLKEHQK